MKRIFAWWAILLLAGWVAFGWNPTGPSAAAQADRFTPLLGGAIQPGETGESVTYEGVLVYYPPPDLTICFCGSFYLDNSDREAKSYFLLSSGVDLGVFIGKKITVTGKPILIPCSGTLFRYCDFLVLEHVDENAANDESDDTWGRIKALFQ